jgi:hypothetical protein
LRSDFDQETTYQGEEVQPVRREPLQWWEMAPYQLKETRLSPIEQDRRASRWYASRRVQPTPACCAVAWPPLPLGDSDPFVFISLGDGWQMKPNQAHL